MQELKCPASWSPPTLNSYKINVDKAIFVAQKSADVGILIWDESGRLIGASSKKILSPLGVIEVEAKAIEFGLHFAKDMLI